MNGTYDHSNSVNFKYRLRKLFLGKHAVLILKHANVRDENELVCLKEGNIAQDGENRGRTYDERQLATELYVTSACLKIYLLMKKKIHVWIKFIYK